jgi:GrpB-like predicted nucleotidyltransferase (UPF0157 family)
MRRMSTAYDLTVTPQRARTARVKSVLPEYSELKRRLAERFPNDIDRYIAEPQTTGQIRSHRRANTSGQAGS